MIALGALILARAIEIWDKRERDFPRFVQQRWDQGTTLARDATLVKAMEEMGV